MDFSRQHILGDYAPQTLAPVGVYPSYVWLLLDTPVSRRILLFCIRLSYSLMLRSSRKVVCVGSALCGAPPTRVNFKLRVRALTLPLSSSSDTLPFVWESSLGSTSLPTHPPILGSREFCVPRNPVPSSPSLDTYSPSGRCYFLVPLEIFFYHKIYKNLIYIL